MYQKTIIVGNVGRDAEMRYTPSGVPVADFSLATNRRWTDHDGNPQERTTLVQGHLLAQAGRNRRAVRSARASSSWSRARVEASAFTGKDGEARATLELTANNFKFLGGRRDNGEGEGETGETVGRTDEIGGDTEIPF